MSFDLWPLGTVVWYVSLVFWIHVDVFLQTLVPLDNFWQSKTQPQQQMVVVKHWFINGYAGQTWTCDSLTGLVFIWFDVTGIMDTWMNTPKTIYSQSHKIINRHIFMIFSLFENMFNTMLHNPSFLLYRQSAGVLKAVSHLPLSALHYQVWSSVQCFTAGGQRVLQLLQLLLSYYYYYFYWIPVWQIPNSLFSLAAVRGNSDWGQKNEM